MCDKYLDMIISGFYFKNVYFVVLGICVCCVTIFGLVVCLFKIRQQW